MVIGKPSTRSITPMWRKWYYWRRSVFSRNLKIATVALFTVLAWDCSRMVYCSCNKEGIPEHCSIRLYVFVFELVICVCHGVCRLLTTQTAARWLIILYRSTSLSWRLRISKWFPAEVFQHLCNTACLSVITNLTAFHKPGCFPVSHLQWVYVFIKCGSHKMEPY